VRNPKLDAKHLHGFIRILISSKTVS